MVLNKTVPSPLLKTRLKNGFGDRKNTGEPIQTSNGQGDGIGKWNKN